MVSRHVAINFGIIMNVNIYGKLTYPGPEVDLEYYVITMTKLLKFWHIEADIEFAYRCCVVVDNFLRSIACNII